MLNRIQQALVFYIRALQQFHDRPFEVAVAERQHTQRPAKSQANLLSAEELGRLAKGT